MKVSLRCGANEEAFQMRCTVETEGPDALAIERVLQCVASAGVASSVFVTTSVIFSSSILRGAPQRGSSSRPSKPRAANRLRHVKTVILETPTSSAMAQLFKPSAARRTIMLSWSSTFANDRQWPNRPVHTIVPLPAGFRDQSRNCVIRSRPIARSGRISRPKFAC